jgi:hypothetical protein
VDQDVQVLADEHPDGIAAGVVVDEVAVTGPPELHLGEEIDNMLNERRLQRLVRDNLMQLALAPAPLVH